jgi:hypothetical protein
LHNATKNRNTLEGKKIPDYKPKYKEIDPEEINLHDENQIMSAKIDGAHTITTLHGPEKMMRVYSYRPAQRESGLIEHTFKFPNFHNRKSDSDTKNTIIRTEAWASKNGKAIPVQELSGILNSGTPKARETLKQQGIDLRLTGIDVVRHNGKNYENRPFAEKLKALEQINKSTKGLIELPIMAQTPEEKRRLLEAVKKNQLPETKEGVILQDLHTAAAPKKAVIKPMQDVYVRKVFTKERGAAKNQASGFEYSFEPDGPVAGRVGTGFSQKQRKDMQENPGKYLGLVATLKSQGRFGGKALRAPAFKYWHPDKNDPEQMSLIKGKEND